MLCLNSEGPFSSDFLDYLNNVNETRKIKFTMEIADQEKRFRISRS